MRRFVFWFVAAIVLLLVVETLASIIPTNQWWLQALNFPRPLMLIVIGVLAIFCVFARQLEWRPILIGGLALAAGLQAWRMYPYFWFAPTEVARVEANGGGTGASCFTLLGLNVLQHNHDYARTRALIDRERPDILLLMETDHAWVDALAPVLSRYPSRLLRPIDNTYGLVFATRLPVRSAGTKNITDQDTPTVYATLETRDGQPFDYIRLHPRPPLPGQDTALRDRKIERAALAISHHKRPGIAMGDFNDVAWSRTTQLFKQIGGYLDPRIGRGSYPSFPANYAPVGWPLDQLFMSPGFSFTRLDILEDVGSDHRPLAARLCLSGEPARRRNTSPEELDPQARKAARSMTNMR